MSPTKQRFVGLAGCQWVVGRSSYRLLDGKTTVLVGNGLSVPTVALVARSSPCSFGHRKLIGTLGMSRLRMLIDGALSRHHVFVTYFLVASGDSFRRKW